MRKTLSLKKTSALPLKNQKSITQFFKNDNVTLSQVQHSRILGERQITQSGSVPLSKRKASDEVVYVGSSASVIQDIVPSKSTKKIKYDNTMAMPSKNSNNKVKKSPQKENFTYINDISPSPITNTSQFNPQKTNKLDNHVDCSPNSKKEHNDGNKNENSKSSSRKLNYDFNSIENHNEVYSKINENNNTPIISPAKDNVEIPVISLSPFTPEKVRVNELSPSKKGSTVKVLTFTDNSHKFGDVFADEWDLNYVDEGDVDDLDLSVLQRCEILNVISQPTRLEVRLKNATHNKGTCYIEGIWVDTPLSPGDTVAVIATRNSSGDYCVGNTSGLLVLRPDYLMSSTSVVAGVFCKRKAILQERWRGLDSANSAMTIGIIIHELVQKALTEKISSLNQIEKEVEILIKESKHLLYDAGLCEEEVRNIILMYISPLVDFMGTYFNDGTVASVAKKAGRDTWNGCINKVLDIEENLCCPQLGLKGKIDATLQVTVNEKKGSKQATVPLELKSGKASLSAEHRGQLVLYGMMLAALHREDPSRSDQRGLLLYLKNNVELREVSCGYPERRDLVMLRNQLVQYLAAGPQAVDPEQLVDIEDASCLLQQKLPEPIQRENVCSKCPYLTICSLHLWHTDGPSVADTHPLSTLRESALAHLSPDHIKYFLHWTTLLRIEERGQLLATPLHSLWTDSVEKRVKRGTCISNLHIKSVNASGDRFLHVFQKQPFNEGKNKIDGDSRGPQEGEFCIVSLDDRPWIAAGVVLLAKNNQVHMLLERDLSHRQTKSTHYHVDTYESYATTVQNLTNLGVLLEDTDISDRLRRLIIDKQAVEFDKKMPREVGRIGTKLMRSLNIEQQRAVLRALAAQHYVLLRGLPGTGKTQTISVLIQMLVALKQRVLVTAHTHSAVDTVLSRLPKSMKVMRLGAISRIANCLADRSEQQLTAACSTVKELEELYNSMEVVGVTCLGAAHAMLSRTSFDVCIVDEATQVLQSTVLRPLFAAKRFVLVGDPEQLPPVVRSKAARRMGMEESLFHRLMSEEATISLRLQYRMNQTLVDLANRVAYDGLLKCAGDAVANSTLNVDIQSISALTDDSPWLSTACSPKPEHAAVFVDLKANGQDATKDIKACINKMEASVVICLAETLIQGGVKSSDIGVIAPFRDQVALLKRSLAGLAEVSTVDQFQGRDKPVIIYSCTKSEEREQRSAREGEVLNDQRRLAVSVTRAKHKLIVVGSSSALHRYKPLQKLMDACTLVTMSKHEISALSTKYQSQVM